MTATAHCGRYIWSRGEDRLCGQTVGLRHWYDDRGREHAACRAHIGVMRSVYPPADPPEPAWDLPEAADEVSVAKGWAERESWTST